MMMKDLRKEEKSLGDQINIPKKGTLTVRYKIEYHDKHFQRVIAYIGICSDKLWRAAYHNNSSPRIRIVKGSRSINANLTLSKLHHHIKSKKQIVPQWV